MAVNEDTPLKDTLLDCLSQQLGEYELLKSMYPDQGEIVLNDKKIISEIKFFLSKKSKHIPNLLAFKLNLQMNSLKVEIFINLPSLYPKEEPDIYIRCNQMNRTSESSLNANLSKYITENHLGEGCLYTAISWLQENIDKFTIATQELNSIDSGPVSKDKEFARFWVYSHHIYCRRKRDEIIRKARELNLTGFTLLGKPGIICIEGCHSDCNEWWKDIKSLNWQKISIRKTEIFASCEEKTYKKFSNFEECQMSMSELTKSMNEVGLNNDLNDFFGICNDDCT